MSVCTCVCICVQVNTMKYMFGSNVGLCMFPFMSLHSLSQKIG